MKDNYVEIWLIAILAVFLLFVGGMVVSIGSIKHDCDTYGMMKLMGSSYECSMINE